MIDFAALLVAGAVTGAPSIRIEKATLSFPSPRTLRIEVAAVGEGVAVGSYGLRTAAEDTPTPAGFRARGKFAYLQAAGEEDEHWYLFFDNMRGDGDAREGAVAVTIDVSEWQAGEYRFLLFACNRPAPGAYVHDTRMLRVVVAGERIVRDRTCFLEDLSLRITRFIAEPDRLGTGGPCKVSATVEATGIEGVHFLLTVPYTVGPDEVPPGFHYDAAGKMAYLMPEPYRFTDNSSVDQDPAPGSLSLEVPTEGWKPGVYNLTFVAAADEAPQDVMDYRDFAVTVQPEDPRFQATLGHDQFLKPGTHFGCFCKLADGSVLAADRVTGDGGRTWQALAGSIPMAHQLSDGTVIGLGFRTQPIEGRPGFYTAALAWSDDGGRTVPPATRCEVHVPRATSGIGHAPAAGPLFFRSIVEMPDGSLLAAMYGWFEGDESPVPGQPGSFRYRTFLVRSDDRGQHWEYHATVAYDPGIGTDGYCEPAMRMLSDGELLCLLRTGGNNRPFHQDNPLCVTRSADGGKTWPEPERTGFEGVAPDLVIMSDGTLACSTGRPGAWLLLSTDNGRTWGHAISINAERYSGYTAVVEVEPGVLLVGYGAKDWLDPETGQRRSCLRTVRVQLQRVD